MEKGKEREKKYCCHPHTHTHTQKKKKKKHADDRYIARAEKTSKPHGNNHLGDGLNSKSLKLH